jgi:type I restriction enzyme S subunit
MANLKRYKIPVPPTKAEQDAIAEALSDVDGLLGALDRLIAKKRDLKRAAMQQLLTGKRIPTTPEQMDSCRSRSLTTS